MFTDPYPGQPTDGQALDAVPILAKFNALFQAGQSFNGSQIQAGTVGASALASTINPNTLLHDTVSPFVQSGCVWSQTSGLVGTMSSGVIYAGTSSAIYRVAISGIGSYTFTASKDTYIDIDYNANVYYQAVSNGASAPSITANAIRVAKVVTGASAISSVVQTGSDGIGNIIYPLYSQNPYKFSAWVQGGYNTSTSLAIWPFDTVSFDTSSNFSTSNHYFIVPINGFYQVDMVLNVNPSGSGLGTTCIAINGTPVRYGTNFNDTYNMNIASGSWVMQLNAGQQLSCQGNTANSVSIASGSTWNCFSGFLVSKT